MNDRPVFILQSGFVTDDMSGVKQSEEQDLTPREALYQKAYSIIDASHFYDPKIEEIFLQWHADNTLMSRFEFREMVLRQAYRVFGRRNFLDWLHLQINRYSVGFLHRQFLKETVQFIFEGKERSTENFQYYRLLSADETSRKHLAEDLNAGDWLKQNIKAASKTPMSTNMSEVLWRWTRDQYGFTDLITSMYVIFGRRNGIHGVGS